MRKPKKSKPSSMWADDEMSLVRSLRRRGLGTAALAAAILVPIAGCGSDDDEGTASTTTSAPTSTTAEAAPAIVGTWQRVNSCAAMVKAFEDAGLDDLTAEWLVGAEFWSSTEDIPSPDPCEGAREVEHSHFFEENGFWGSRDEDGKQVDEGIYQLTDDDTLGFGDFTVGYHIADDTLTFDAVVPPNPCTDDCRGEYAHLVSAFYPGEFQRQA
jgi:hypothetical protein